MDDKERSKALTFSTLDGALSATMGALAGGIFLTGFALKILAANPAQIGVLAALPLFANLVQIFGSYLIEKTGKRKPFCFWGVVFARVLWVLIILLPFKIFAPISDFRVWILVLVIALSSIFGSLSGVAWLTWMSDLVPSEIRGAYFGKRNMVASFCGMVIGLVGGKFITIWENKYSETNPYGFIILFGVGLISGLIAAWFLSRVPEIEGKKDTNGQGFKLTSFISPLKDKNFVNLIIFVAAWNFSIQLAGPFYGVFMINYLKIDFSTIMILGTLATFSTMFMMKIWGPIADKLGNKPIIIVSVLILVGVPFIWLFTVPTHYYSLLIVAHFLSGIFMAGAVLSQFNILIKLSPQEGRSIYLALFAAITGFIGATGPMVGGILSNMLETARISIAQYTLTNLHFIFVISALAQVVTLFFIYRVREPAAATPVAVVMQLKNDLNPQTGIAGAADFLMLEIKHGEGILKKVDRVTDEIAQKSEQKIGKVLDKGENLFKKPVQKIKDFLKDDE